MTTRRDFLLGSLILTLTGGRGSAAEPSAQAFLESLYAHYRGKDAKGIAYGQRRAELTRYFTSSLARLIEADLKAAAKRGDVPELDGDPFVNAQDWDIEAFDISVKDIAPGKAVGTVKFKNQGEEATITIDLLKTGAGWRIDDVRTPNHSLRAMFNKK